jgi:hypothetical protein
MNRREDNIKTSSRNRMSHMDWADLAQDRVMWQAFERMVNLSE